MENQSENETSLLTPELPKTNEKSNKKTWLIAILVVLLCITIAALLAGAFKYRRITSELAAEKLTNVSEKTESIVEKPTIAISPFDTEQPEELAASSSAPVVEKKQKTFENAFFSFTYPEDMTIQTQEGGVVQVKKWGPTQKADTELYDGVALQFEPLELPVSAQQYSLTDIEGTLKSGMAEILSGPTQVTIGNNTGYFYRMRFLGTASKYSFDTPNDSIIVVVTDNTTDPGSIGFQEEADAILKSLVLKKY